MKFHVKDFFSKCEQMWHCGFDRFYWGNLSWKIFSGLGRPWHSSEEAKWQKA